MNAITFLCAVAAMSLTYGLGDSWAERSDHWLDEMIAERHAIYSQMDGHESNRAIASIAVAPEGSRDFSIDVDGLDQVVLSMGAANAYVTNCSVVVGGKEREFLLTPRNVKLHVQRGSFWNTVDRNGKRAALRGIELAISLTGVEGNPSELRGTIVREKDSNSLSKKSVDCVFATYSKKELEPRIKQAIVARAAELMADAPSADVAEDIFQEVITDDLFLTYDAIGSIASNYAAKCGGMLRAEARAIAAEATTAGDVRRVRQVYRQAKEVESLREEMGIFNADALARAIDDLAGKYPQQFDKSRLIGELDAIRSQMLSVNAQLAKYDISVIEEARGILDFKRRVLLCNPILDFDEILVVKRRRAIPEKAPKNVLARFHHTGLPKNYYVNSSLPSNGWDSSIGVISLKGDFASFATSRDLFMGDVSLHFDAEKLLYSSADPVSDTWQVFELNLKDKSTRQVSIARHSDIDNFDACYRPDGKIIYASTAGFQGVPCVAGNGIVANLHVMNPDGTGIRRLTFDQESNWSPYVMEDGRIMYQRWDYTDMPHFWNRVLLTMNPDGTDQKGYYGSNSWWPNTLFYGKSIPGSPGKFTAIVSGHHGPREGQLVLFDAFKGHKDIQGVVQAIPGFGKTIEPIVVDGYFGGGWPKIAHTQPLSADYHLAAVKLSRNDRFGIYLIDRFDNLLPLQRSRSHHLFEPTAFRKRKKPPVIPDRVRPGDREATVSISDIYAGPGLAGVPRGTVKKLRILTYEFGLRDFAGNSRVGIHSSWDVRCILGTVDVEEDGSVMFKVPSNTPLSLQPLDSENKALAMMRSWFTAMPGEHATCVGCHENENTVSPPEPMGSFQEAPQVIKPWYGPVRGFSFLREVQPVLDKHCVGCHDGQAEGRLNLADTEMIQTGGYWLMQNPMPQSYVQLQQFVRRPGPEGYIDMLTPLNFHANTSELIQRLEKGHHNVRLDAEAWDRLVTWIDLNAPAMGSWAEMNPPAKVLETMQRRADMYKEYGTGVTMESENNREPYRRTEAFVAPEKSAGPTPPPAVDGWPLKIESGAMVETLDMGNGVTMDFVSIPAGKFVMGSNSESPDEQPMHVVSIDRPFKMGVTEVSLEQYQQFAKEHRNGLYNKPGQVVVYGFSMDRGSFPAIRVSWDEANAFCRWLSKKTGKVVQLPTEGQWEWACRAGTATRTFFGDSVSNYPSYANLSDPTSDMRRTSYFPSNHWSLERKNEAAADKAHCLSDVGSYRANAFGLKDMLGNVAEWTRSAFSPYPYSDTDGRNEMEGDRKVVRGGSWNDRPIHGTSSYRLSYPRWQRAYNVGFRIIISESDNNGVAHEWSLKPALEVHSPPSRDECPVQGSVAPSDHPLFGRWRYEAGGHPYSREFTADGKCILRQGDRVIWKKQYSVLNGTDIQVTGEPVHSYRSNVPNGAYMEVGRRYRATR